MTSPEPEIWPLLDGSRHDYRDRDRPRPVRLYLWRPATPAKAAPSPMPAVVISHGTGGSALHMSWLAAPLAEAGFLVLAVDHHGNNDVDGYLPQGFAFEWERPRDLTFALDEVARRLPLGAVGAAGFSSGGYTSAALVGARINPAILQAVLDGRAHTPELPEFPGLLTALREAVPDKQLREAADDAAADLSDPRVRAAFLICPALGRLVTDESLGEISRPVAVRWGDADVITPPETDALRYLTGISTATGKSVGADVEHYHFLAGNPAGEKARQQTAAEAVAFFATHVGAAR